MCSAIRVILVLDFAAMRSLIPAFQAPVALSSSFHRTPVRRRPASESSKCCAADSSIVDVQWHSPRVANARPLVFLSGLDGSPLPGAQVQSLSSRAYAPIVSVSHARGALDAGWDALAGAVDDVVESAGGGSAVLVGESFGAALALRVAARRKEGLHRLVLVNSGTALEESSVLSALTRLLPLLKLDGSGRVFYRAAALVLFKGFLADDRRLDASIVPGDWSRRTVDIDRVPLDTMLHRVDMLRRFSETFTDACISRLVSSRVTLVASGRDRLLPSLREAERLGGLLPNVERKVILKDSSHACLLESGVRLGDILGDAMPAASGESGRDAGDMSPSVASSAVHSSTTSNDAGVDGDGDEELSRDEALKIGRKWLAPWRAYVRPAFEGSENVREAIRLGGESGRAVLFVGNHGVYGILDTSIIIDELSRLVGPSKLLRSLAHDTHFAQFSEATNGRYGRFVRAIGAVPATPRNFFRLLKSGEPVLLFPGGSSEVCRRRGDKNVVQWKASTDFVRPVARHNAIVVPFSSAGADDSVELLLDGQEMQQLPVLGPALTRLLEANDFDPQHVMPLGTLPKPMQYKFRFHAPIFTDEVDESDSAACAELYQRIRGTVQNGVYDLSAQSQAQSVLPSPQEVGQRISSGVGALLDDLLMF